MVDIGSEHECTKNKQVQNFDEKQNAEPANIPELEKYVDLNDALNRIRGNRKLYKTLLQSFLSDSYMEVLAENIKGGNIAEAAKTVHTIKGASANLSLVGLNRAIITLETHLKKGVCDKDAAKDCFDAFEETKRVIKELLNMNIL